MHEYYQSTAFNLLALYYNVKSSIMHTRLGVKLSAQKNTTTWLSDSIRLLVWSGSVRSGPVQVLKRPTNSVPAVKKN